MGGGRRRNRQGGVAGESKTSTFLLLSGGTGREVRGRVVSAPRIVARGATYAATRRCVCRKAYLGWWDAAVDAIWLWCLATAAATCGVEIHHAVRVGNHYHITFTVTRNNLGEFLWRLNHPMSCALNVLLSKRGYEPPGQIFDGRQMHVMRLLDAEAQMASLVYERVNVVDAGLADTCDGIPGVTLGPVRWKHRVGLRVPKPDVYFAKGDAQRLALCPPAELYLAFGGDMEALVHHMGVLEREEERRIRAARGSRRARTHAQVRAIDPSHEPRRRKEPGGGRVPVLKTRLGALAHIKGAVEVHNWRQQYAAAERDWRDGDSDVVFPHGTHLLAARYGVNVAEPAPDAWVSAPGPTFAEAHAMVAEGGVARDPSLPDRVRGLLTELATSASAECDDKQANPAEPQPPEVEPAAAANIATTRSPLPVARDHADDIASASPTEETQTERSDAGPRTRRRSGDPPRD